MTTATLSNGFEVRTASEVSEIMQPHPDVLDGMLCGVALTKRGERLNAKECRVLREWAAENVVYGVLMMNEDTAKAILGLEQVDPKIEPPFIKLDDTYYAARNNLHNRRLILARLGDAGKPGYAHDMVQDLWGFGDPLIVHADAVIGSAQHRAAAYLIAKQSNPELGDIPFPIMLHVPPQFGDFLDRGKSRDPKDTEYRDVTNFQQPLIDSEIAELDMVDLPKLREKWSKTLVTSSVNIFARCHGVNVHPSKTKSPSPRERLQVQERFGNEDDLQRLILRVWGTSRTPDDKPASWTKVWSEALVVTAIVLRSNAHHDDQSKLVIDWDYADRFLEALSESSYENASGPFGPSLADVVKAKADLKKAGGSAVSQQELFGCLVAAVGQFDESGTTDKVWQGKRDRRKAKNAGTFRCFGGVDVGFQGEEKE
jgi:hypothetical protein